MTTCRELFEALYEFTAEELPPERQEEMRQHQDGCASCAALVESYQIIIRLARQLPPVALSPVRLARLRAAVDAAPGRPELR
jgi:hypothetical protein